MKLIIHFTGTGDDPGSITKKEEREVKQTHCISQQCNHPLSGSNRQYCRVCRKDNFCSQCAPSREDYFNLSVCNDCYTEIQRKGLESGIADFINNRFYFETHQLEGSTALLIINGCHKTDVAGKVGRIFPDLSIICEKLRRLFNGNKFPITEYSLRSSLGDAYGGFYYHESRSGMFSSDIENLKQVDYKIVDHLILSGYSRGAVTCFAFAKYLNQRNLNDIPVYIFADQPVPGNHWQNSFSISQKHINLTSCTNIKFCKVILGSYDKKSMPMERRTFYKQMLPDFNPRTELEIERIPVPDHDYSEHFLSLSYAYARDFFVNSLDRYGIQACIYQFDFNSELNSLYQKHRDYRFAAPGFEQSIFMGGEREAGFRPPREPQFQTSNAFSHHYSKIKRKPEWTTQQQNSCISTDCENPTRMGHRHHCRLCGTGHFCDTCAPKRKYFRNERLCNACHKNYLNFARHQVEMNPRSSHALQEIDWANEELIAKLANEASIRLN
ncbi:PHD finger domain-containing protein [Dongshaea marina]|uniref:hypothetical protein n=1 Tax=Dongshaea marina TaxID=2047966 RepID=UPI000D3ED57D|nr:hypothetical protein [Dongshaea marina]